MLHHENCLEHRLPREMARVTMEISGRKIINLISKIVMKVLTKK